MTDVATAHKQRRRPDIDDPDKFYANRVRVYPKAVHGPARTFKWAVLMFCLSLYYVLPWLRWNRGPGHPDQMVLLDLPNRRFYFANIELWPQDIYLLAGALILAAVGLFLVTSLFGRALVRLYMPADGVDRPVHVVERRIEGDRNERMKRDEGPWTADKADARVQARRLGVHRVLDRRRLDDGLRQRADRGVGVLDRARFHRPLFLHRTVHR